MATTPRYIATTVADAKTYVSAAVGADVFVQVFDLDRDGSVAGADETTFARAVARAETEVDEVLAASHGTPWSAAEFAALTSATQDAVREIAAELTPWHAVRFRPSMKDEAKAPFRLLWKDARQRLKDLHIDRERRLPGMGAPEPTATAGGVVSVDLNSNTLTGLDWQRNASSGTGGY